jgi:uncharacterized membrane protein YoaK (UPF0700 family)
MPHRRRFLQYNSMDPGWGPEFQMGAVYNGCEKMNFVKHQNPCMTGTLSTFLKQLVLALVIHALLKPLGDKMQRLRDTCPYY